MVTVMASSMPAAPLESTATRAGPAAIAAAGLTKSYGRTRALAGLDLHVAVGETVALLGPTGPGRAQLSACCSAYCTPIRARCRCTTVRRRGLWPTGWSVPCSRTPG